MKQLDFLVPDGHSCSEAIEKYFDAAMRKTEICVFGVRAWHQTGFNYLNSGQYATFLYFLSACIHEARGNDWVAERLFLLNKALNGLDLFYEVKLPEVFIIGHTSGMVFTKATYGNFLLVHQYCTVGRKREHRPVLGKGVVMFPGSMIIGNCHVGDNSVIAPGVRLIDMDVPGNCYVLEDGPGRVKFKELKRSYLEEYFVLSPE